MAKKSAPVCYVCNIQKKEKYIIPRKKRRRGKGKKRSGKRDKREKDRGDLSFSPPLPSSCAPSFLPFPPTISTLLSLPVLIFVIFGPLSHHLGQSKLSQKVLNSRENKQNFAFSVLKNSL